VREMAFRLSRTACGFGAVFTLGLTRPDGGPRSQDELVKFQRQVLCLIMQMVGHSIGALVLILAPELNLEDMARRSRELDGALASEPWNAERSTGER
jgi:hypothetical protein